VHHLFTDLKKVYASVGREVSLIELIIPMKLIRLIQMYLNETCNRVRVDRHLSDMFPIKNVLKQGDSLLALLLSFQ
jgi:hypothetical protein